MRPDVQAHGRPIAGEKGGKGERDGKRRERMGRGGKVQGGRKRGRGQGGVISCATRTRQQANERMTAGETYSTRQTCIDS